MKELEASMLYSAQSCLLRFKREGLAAGAIGSVALYGLCFWSVVAAKAGLFTVAAFSTSFSVLGVAMPDQCGSPQV